MDFDELDDIKALLNSEPGACVGQKPVQRREPAPTPTQRLQPEQKSQPASQPEPKPEPRTPQKKNRREILQRRLTTISLTLLLLTFGALAISAVILPRSTISQIEQRKLAEFPKFSVKSYFAGDFTGGITLWYDDTVPNRDSFKNLGNDFKGRLGLPKKEDSVEFYGPVNLVNPGTTPAQPEGTTSTVPAGTQPEATNPADTLPPETEPGALSFPGVAGRHMAVEGTETDNNFVNQEAEGSWENGLIVVKQNGHYRALELFGGGSGNSFAEALNTIHKELGDDVSVWAMPAPLACEFYTPSNYQEYTKSQSECFQNIAAKLDPGITLVNACDTLSLHTQEDIYCRTDHHWQPLGAYYACKAFAEAAGVPFNDLSTYTQQVNHGYVGTMYGFTGSADIKNDPEDFVYYVPSAPYEAHYYSQSFSYSYSGDLFADVDTANSYLVFMGGDSHVVKVDTEVKNGRKLVVVKDSYGNAEIPFYTGSFEQIYVVDMRHFERNLVSFIQDMGITDVLFTMSSYSAVGGNADHLMTLITQNAGETIVDGQLTEEP